MTRFFEKTRTHRIPTISHRQKLNIIAVMFTFSFSSAFAANPNPASTSAADSQAAFSKVVADALKTISYNGKGYVGSGLSSEDNNYLSKTAIEQVASEFEAHYLAEIGKVNANWDDVWTSVNDENKVVAALETAPYLAKIWEAQVDIEKTAAYSALTPDVSAYTTKSQKEIKAVVDAQTNALESAVANYVAGTNDKDTIDAFKAVVTAIDTALKNGEKASDATGAIATATANATKALTEAAANFTDAVEDAYKTPANTTEAARKASLNTDVDKVVAFYEDAIEYGKVDSSNADMNTTAKVVAYLNSVQSKIADTFSTTSPFDKFYNALDKLKTGDFVTAALEKDATAKKVERNTDGTLKYRDIDVDKALADAKDDVKATLRNDILNDSNNIARKATTLTVPANQAYELKAYKAAAITKITTDDYALANWAKDRKDKVEAIQDDYSDQILVAKSADAVDALVKEAKEKMDAILTTAQINTLKSRTDARISALDYDDMLAKYYDAVVGTKGYSAKIKTDAIAAAKDLIKDAVIAKENKDLTYAEIDEIIKANKDAAIAKVTDVKTTDELKAQANELKTLFDSLPTTVTVADKETILSAQKAFDTYLELPGTATTDVINAYKLKNAMKSLMTEEAKAVNAQIKALPETITINDADAIKAARDAYKALEETYGDYDNDSTFNYLGATVQSLVSRANALTTAETNLEKAKVEDAAKKIEALTSSSTLAEVKAAQAAYDALKLESKLYFNDELYAKLVAVQKGIIPSTVEALKITARSTAKKGSITVSWTVKGEAAAADGYRIYRSTKKNIGFGTKPLFTTTKQTYKNTKNLKKGTRYYYKVRAYKVVDGKTYFSDWSNKAIRIAK